MTARKRLTVEGDWALEGDLWVLRSPGVYSAKVAVGVIPREAVVSVEDIPAPLPTEPGTVVDALVTIGEISERRVVVRSDDEPLMADRLIWFSARKIAGVAWLADERLSDWRVIPTAPPTPEPVPVVDGEGIPEPTEVGAIVRDREGDRWRRRSDGTWILIADDDTPRGVADRWEFIVGDYGPLEVIVQP